MSIPLVQNNEKDSINTSIIAIKKNLERINSILGLVDSSEPDLSGFATKQELEDTVTEINNTIDEVETSLQPVDTVASGNMHSVTSNAVASAMSETKTFTVSLMGWANDAGSTPYTIKSITATGYKIADKTYVIPVTISPRDSDPAPSRVVHLIEVANIEGILLVGSVYTRATTAIWVVWLKYRVQVIIYAE